MSLDKRILITGGGGLLGSALRKRLADAGYRSIVAPSSREVDLLSPDQTSAYFEKNRPEAVFHLAGAVFGLGGNLKNPGDIFYRNTVINTNVIEASRRMGTRKIVAMGSICAYPFPTMGKLREENLLSGEPHSGERAYGHSKRAALAQLEANHAGSGPDYAFMLSTNLYGPHDRFNLQNGHVVPSLIRKFREAKVSGDTVEIWGDGTSKRDCMYSEDAADALIAAMEKGTGRFNLATGKMTSIGEIAKILGKVSGIGDRIRFDTSRPRGHEFEAISVERLAGIGFKAQTTLEDGLRRTFDWYEKNHATARE